MKYLITTLGCKVNQYESESISQSLKDSGLSPAQDNEDADICIINTCTVTQKASMQSRQAVRRTIKNSPGARIIVTGCDAQTEPEALGKIKVNTPEVITALESLIHDECDYVCESADFAIDNITENI